MDNSYLPRLSYKVEINLKKNIKLFWRNWRFLTPKMPRVFPSSYKNSHSPNMSNVMLQSYISKAWMDGYWLFNRLQQKLLLCFQKDVKNTNSIDWLDFKLKINSCLSLLQLSIKLLWLEKDPVLIVQLIFVLLEILYLKDFLIRHNAVVNFIDVTRHCQTLWIANLVSSVLLCFICK